ncbi:MAG: family 78 glycoside hydrolase catalytic domain, partial [Spirochaetia bacterium]
MQAPITLTCEYAEFPKGFLGNQPRFAWRLPGTDAPEEQSAYRLIISADPERIKDGTGDTADTGFVESGENTRIRIPGLRLQPHVRYYWSVQLKDRNGKTGPFQAPASFITGISAESWPGKWISRKTQESYKPNEKNLFREYYASYFRKTFETRSPVREAVLSVSGIGYGLVTVNGREPDKRFLDPAQTDYSKRALYATYDVTPFICSGENCIGVIVGNGRHVEEYGYGKPRMSAVLTLRYEDGMTEQVVSDTSWQTASGPITRNSIYHGTEIDNRRDMPGWDRGAFSGENWEEAEEIEGPPLYPQLLPEIKAEREIEPVKMWSPGESRYIFDFGQNMSGAARITVRGPAGTKLTLRYAELVDEDGTLNTVTNRSARVTDTFICGGQGAETFFPHFTYHGFRYVEVTGYPGVPDADCLRAVFFYSAVEQTGSFSCSHDLINR